MKYLMHIIVMAFMLITITACKPSKPVTYDLEHPEKYDPNPLVIPKNITPAEMIASAGHGAFFDHSGKPLAMNDELVLSMQSSMIDQLRESAWKNLDTNTQQTLEDAFKLTQSSDIKSTEKTFLNAMAIETLQKSADKTLRENLVWRHNLLLQKIRIDYIQWEPRLNQRIIDVMTRLELRSIFENFSALPTDYVARCRADGVPIPPAWSLAAPSTWRYQGLLDNELIQASEETHLWTWADPHIRGGCILLPRGPRGSGVAGIICQSATTGKACFWDNIPRTGIGRVNWSTATLNVNSLQDGDSLIDNCTRCHRGSNVFLISPDNTTWKKVIKQWQSTVNAGASFTTRIENAAIPRYIPVSSQPGWTNPSAPACIGCHERPAVGFGPPSPMPPSCRTSDTDPAGCYN